jgi:hypothetical protein
MERFLPDLQASFSDFLIYASTSKQLHKIFHSCHIYNKNDVILNSAAVRLQSTHLQTNGIGGCTKLIIA